MYGDILPITMFGSIGGIYAPVHGQTNERSYSAEIIVRQFDFIEPKAETILGTSYHAPKLDYWLSTKNTMGYSDFGDPLVVGYLQSKGIVNPFAYGFGIPEYTHDRSSMYYVREQLLKETADNSDTHLDTIIPTIDYDYANNRFSPRFSFADSMGGFPVPEFYTNFPVIVTDDSQAIDQYCSIYKTLSVEDPQELTNIEIELFDPGTELEAGIVSIDTYLIWSKTIAGDLSVTQSSYVNTLSPEEFDVDLSTGIVSIISGNPRSTIINSFAEKVKNLDPTCSQPKILFQIKVEKYRAVSDLRDLTAEQINKIATAQAVEAAILEYNYQFNLATQTQLGFSELVYTTVVTAISTALTMVVTAGVGSAINSLSGIGSKSASDLVSEGVSKSMARVLSAATSSTFSSFTSGVLVKAIVKEIGQELLLDPWIESTVSGIVRRGFNGDAMMQAFWSTLAESGRETISGPISSIFSSQRSGDIQSPMDIIEESYYQKGVKPTIQEVLLAQSEYNAKVRSAQQERREQINILGKSMKALNFMALAIGFGASMLLGPVAALTYTTLTTYFSTGAESLKDVFKKAFNPVIAASRKIGDAVRNNKWQILGALGIGVVGAFIGVPIAGFLAPMFGPILGTIATGGITIATLILTMFGMVRKVQPKNEIKKEINSNEILKRDVQSSIDSNFEENKYKLAINPLLEEYLKSKRITYKNHDQELLKKIWKLGVHKGEYVFGMIYKWTNTKSGEFGYDTIRGKIGRTEQVQGSHQYLPVSGISIRFSGYIFDAILPDSIDLLRSDTIAYDMRKVYNDAGGKDAGIKAIVNTFTLEIVEIVMISESYSKDKKIIEQLEDYYMVIKKTLIPEGYNEAPGSFGGHVSELRSGHARKNLHIKLNAIISQGFTIAKIAGYFNLPYKAIQEEVTIAHGGRTFTVVQRDFITERIFSIIDEGYFTLVELSGFFKGFKTIDVFSFLKKTDKGNEYLKGLIASAIASLTSEGEEITILKIAKRLGIKKSTATLRNYIATYMGGVKSLIENYKFFLSPLAVKMIKFCNDGRELLTKLGWLEGLTSRLIAPRTKFLFHTSFSSAKRSAILRYTFRD